MLQQIILSGSGDQCGLHTKPLLDFITHEETWIRKRPYIAYMCVFGCVTYAMVPDEQKDKFDAKGIKCLFFELLSEI